jgi:hypothetical protein
MSRNKTGEWIKLGRDLWTHPKVLRIADILGSQWHPELPLSGADKSRTSPGQMRTMILVHAVVSGLSRLFLAVNRHASEAGDGTMDAVLSDMITDNYLDEVSGLPGMQAAMLAVGWAEHDKSSATVRLPNYLEHNVLHKGEKRRGRPGVSESPEAIRKREARARSKEQAARTAPGQKPDNSPLSGADKARTSADNLTEKRRAEVLKTHIEKNGQVPDTAEPAAPIDEQTVEMGRLKRLVDRLQPGSWGRIPHWSPLDEQELVAARDGLAMMVQKDWDMLAWYFKWAAKPTNAERWPDEAKVTSKRNVFLENLSSYMARADKVHRMAGRPATSSLPASPAPPPTAEAVEMPVVPFREQVTKP